MPGRVDDEVMMASALEVLVVEVSVVGLNLTLLVVAEYVRRILSQRPQVVKARVFLEPV